MEGANRERKLKDEELVARVLAGEFELFSDLVRRYERPILAIIYRIVGNRDDTLDVAQDSFVRACARLGSLNDPDHFAAWLRKIAVNEAKAWLGRRWNHLPLNELLEPKGDMSAVDDRLEILDLLERLDDDSRLTIALFYFEQLSYQQISDLIGDPVTTIKSRLRNARIKLRRGMKQPMKQEAHGNLAERVTTLLNAIRERDAAKIESILREQPELVNAPQPKSRTTPLHVAAGAGNAAVTELLLTLGADPNARDESDNASPLHYAAERGWLDTVKLLVEAGSNVNSSDDLHERGPLGWAVVFSEAKKDVADYLMIHGAQLDIFSAIALERDEDVRRIVQANPDALRAQMSDFDHRLTPLQFAISSRKTEIAHLLVELGAEVGLLEAAGLGLTEQVSQCLSEDQKEGNLNDALKTAVKSGQLKTARLLLQAEANPNYAPDPPSLIFDSIGLGDRAMSQLLLEFGADLEFKDRQWNATALGWQVFFGRPEQTELAIDLGATINPQLIELARAGEAGDLRGASSGDKEGYRKVLEILTKYLPAN